MTFPADIKRCMKDCILAVLWPRKDILRFFRDCSCTKAELRLIENFKTDNTSRNNMVELVFDALSARSDEGLGQFRAMLKVLLGWSHFDKYYFDDLKKLDRATADKHLDHLRQLQEIRDARIKEQAAKQAEKEAASRSTVATLAELKDRFLSLFTHRETSQQRGYKLEGVLRDLSRLSGLETTEPFRVNGEQIDGAMKYDGEHYIIEAKWHDAAASNEPVYQFAHKVEGKMYGRGLFISINGYSAEVVGSLTHGKAIKTILIDGADLTFVVEGLLTFAQLIDRKVKAAQTKGLSYIDPISGKPKS